MANEGQLADMRISEVLEQWPTVADVFQKHAMACVGCVVAPFYTIADAATVYNLPKDEFIAELAAAIHAVDGEQRES